MEERTWAEDQTGLVLSGGTVNVDSAAQASKQKTAEATQGAAVAGAAKGAQQAQAQNQAMVDRFKKAATVCLEGRGYTAK